MKHEILYVKADRTARGAIEGTALQKKFEADPNWQRVFQSITGREEKLKVVAAEIVDEMTVVNLQDINGVGASVEKKLKAGGFYSIKAVADATAEEVSDKAGVPFGKAENIVEAANDLLTEE